jgi:5-methylcytosine-specific restriction endonuclease McrA
MTKEEKRAYDKAWYQANKERIRDSRKAYYHANKEIQKAKREDYFKNYRESNREKIASGQRAYDAANREKNNARTKIWSEENREKRNSKEAGRRARKLNQTPDLNIAEKVEIQCMYLYNQIMPGDWHVDHIVALANGGLHHPANLQILSKFDNLSKGAR